MMNGNSAETTTSLNYLMGKVYYL